MLAATKRYGKLATLVIVLLLAHVVAMACPGQDEWSATKERIGEAAVSMMLSHVKAITSSKEALQTDPLEYMEYDNALKSFIVMNEEATRINGFKKEILEARMRNWPTSKKHYSQFGTRLEEAYEQGVSEFDQIAGKWIEALDHGSIQHEERMAAIKKGLAPVLQALEQWGQNSKKFGPKYSTAMLNQLLAFARFCSVAGDEQEEIVNDPGSTAIEVEIANARLAEVSEVEALVMDKMKQVGFAKENEIAEQ
ncbi:MAG: hypothetical protein KKC99_06430 [Proteobacteria bacterium]|nr:hypothetical protein [Pseudomonadota bacterium]